MNGCPCLYPGLGTGKAKGRQPLSWGPQQFVTCLSILKRHPYPPDPYSLTIRAVVEHTGANQITTFDAHLRPVPAPAGLVLALSGVPVLALGYLWRRKAKAPAA
jgi:hypothetical protein